MDNILYVCFYVSMYVCMHAELEIAHLLTFTPEVSPLELV